MANQTRLFDVTRLRYDSALHGLAMSFGGVKLTGAREICMKFTISGPVFAATGGMSSSTACNCSSTSAAGMTFTRETRTEFCTVSSVITASP